MRNPILEALQSLGARDLTGNASGGIYERVSVKRGRRVACSAAGEHVAFEQHVRPLPGQATHTSFQECQSTSF